MATRPRGLDGQSAFSVKPVSPRAIFGERTFDLEPLFLEIVDKLCDAELTVLSMYGENHKKAERESEPVLRIDYSQTSIFGHTPRSYRVLLQTLVRKGLLYDKSFGFYGGAAYEVMKPTDLGLEFMQWLERPVSSMEPG